MKIYGSTDAIFPNRNILLRDVERHLDERLHGIKYVSYEETPCSLAAVSCLKGYCKKNGIVCKKKGR